MEFSHITKVKSEWMKRKLAFFSRHYVLYSQEVWASQLDTQGCDRAFPWTQLLNQQKESPSYAALSCDLRPNSRLKFVYPYNTQDQGYWQFTLLDRCPLEASWEALSPLMWHTGSISKVQLDKCPHDNPMMICPASSCRGAHVWLWSTSGTSGWCSRSWVLSMPVLPSVTAGHLWLLGKIAGMQNVIQLTTFLLSTLWGFKLPLCLDSPISGKKPISCAWGN